MDFHGIFLGCLPVKMLQYSHSEVELILMPRDILVPSAYGWYVKPFRKAAELWGPEWFSSARNRPPLKEGC